MRYALVDADGRVANLVVWDGNESAWAPPAGITAVPADTNAEVGGSYAGGVFRPAATVPPLPAILRLQLAVELADNPTNRSYARSNYPDDAARTAGVLAELNRPDEAVRIPITPAPVTRGVFLRTVVAPASIPLASASDAVQRKWDRIIGLITVEEMIDVASPQIQGLLQLARADGLLTVAQIAAVTPPTSRAGSRAEQLWGEGAVVVEADLVAAA